MWNKTYSIKMKSMKPSLLALMNYCTRLPPVVNRKWAKT